jgi:hypothetical protein
MWDMVGLQPEAFSSFGNYSVAETTSVSGAKVRTPNEMANKEDDMED